ncbi:35296_t:CDS:10, partial [Racocetra persica]
DEDYGLDFDGSLDRLLKFMQYLNNKKKGLSGKIPRADFISKIKELVAEVEQLKADKDQLATKNKELQSNLSNLQKQQLSEKKTTEEKLRQIEAKLIEVEKRPTSEELTKAVQEEKEKFKDYIKLTPEEQEKLNTYESLKAESEQLKKDLVCSKSDQPEESKTSIGQNEKIHEEEYIKKIGGLLATIIKPLYLELEELKKQLANNSLPTTNSETSLPADYKEIKEKKEEFGINRKFFEDLIENSNLSEEDKKKIGEFKDFKNDTVGEVLKAGEKDKIKDYDKLNEEIKELEQKLTKTEEEAKQKIQNLENDLDKSVQENQNILKNRELAEVQEELEELRKRPDTTISTEEFYNNYAKRKSNEQDELDKQELEKEREKSAKLEQQNNYFLQQANRILENVRIKRYALDEPVITIEKAQEKIAKLLEEKEKELEDYLQGDNSSRFVEKIFRSWGARAGFVMNKEQKEIIRELAEEGQKLEEIIEELTETDKTILKMLIAKKNPNFVKSVRNLDKIILNTLEFRVEDLIPTGFIKYPTKEDKKKSICINGSDFSRRLTISDSSRSLTKLNVNGCINLQDLSLPNNNLTDLDFLSELPNPEKLSNLEIYNNNIKPTNIAIFSKFVNLYRLKIGTMLSIFGRKHNKFYGSFETQRKWQKRTKNATLKEWGDIAELNVLPTTLMQNKITETKTNEPRAVKRIKRLEMKLDNLKLIQENISNHALIDKLQEKELAIDSEIKQLNQQMNTAITAKEQQIENLRKTKDKIIKNLELQKTQAEQEIISKNDRITQLDAVVKGSALIFQNQQQIIDDLIAKLEDEKEKNKDNAEYQKHVVSDIR